MVQPGWERTTLLEREGVSVIMKVRYRALDTQMCCNRFVGTFTLRIRPTHSLSTSAGPLLHGVC
jgi:hypothetical protein